MALFLDLHDSYRFLSIAEAEKLRELPHRHSNGVTTPDSLRDNNQLTIRSVSLRIDVTDYVSARKDGKGIVAANAFKRRGVGFPRVVETPKP